MKERILNFIIVMTLVAIAAALLMGLFIAAQVIPNPIDSESGKKYSAAFVVGAHANSLAIDFDDNSLRKEVKKIAETYGFYSGLAADGKPTSQMFTNENDEDFKKPGIIDSVIDFMTGAQKEKANEREEKIIGVLKSMKAKTPEVDMLKAIELAARQLSNRPPDEIKKIIVLGTGLATTGFLDFAENDSYLLYSNPEEIAEMAEKNAKLPDLTGITVIWYFIHDVDGEIQKEFDDTAKTNLEGIWRTLIINAGGEVIFENSRSNTGGIDGIDIYSVEKGYPYVSAVRAKLPPKPISVEVSPKNPTIRQGDDFDFSAFVVGVNNPSQDVKWSLSGNNSIATTIDQNGKLSIAPEETSKTLEVIAASAVDGSVFGTATVTISLTPAPPAEITHIEFNQKDIVADAGSNIILNVTVYGTNNPSQGVIWKLTGNSDPGTRIDNNGTLHIAPNERSILLTIIATSVYDGTKSTETTVKVIVPPGIVNVKFRPNNDELINESQAVKDINEWVEFIKTQDSGIYLFGCTAESALYDYNAHISRGLTRADTVKSLFVKYYGIDPSKIIAKGLGYDNPWHADNGISGSTWDEAKAERNRKVVIMSADDDYAKKIYNGAWR